MVRKSLIAAAAVAGLAFAAPASASVTITFTGGNSGTDGSDGNIRPFSNGGISAQDSGWSYDGSTLESAWLGRYSQGLGVTNNGEGNGTSSNNHTASLGSAGLYGNAWLIGAGSPNPDRNDDGFKLSSIVVNTPVVHEPVTWAMILLGFGAVGASIRKSRRTIRLPQQA